MRVGLHADDDALAQVGDSALSVPASRQPRIISRLRVFEILFEEVVDGRVFGGRDIDVIAIILLGPKKQAIPLMEQRNRHKVVRANSRLHSGIVVCEEILDALHNPAALQIGTHDLDLAWLQVLANNLGRDNAYFFADKLRRRCVEQDFAFRQEVVGSIDDTTLKLHLVEAGDADLPALRLVFPRTPAR